MRILLLALLLVCAAPALADRAQRPTFKGVELYSWSDAQNWNYVLLPGTNRNKSWSELQTAPRLRTESELKQSLASLAVGEQVFWSNQLGHGAASKLQYPARPAIDALKVFCAQNQVELHVLRR